MTLSIIIAVRNEQDNLLKTLASIRATSPVQHVEIVVIDDASDPPIDPGSVFPQLLETRVVGVAEDSTFPKVNIRFFRTPIRLGNGASRNKAAKHASGEWIMFTDAHMIFPPGWFETLCRSLLSMPNNRLICSQYDFLNSAICDFANPGKTLPGGYYQASIEDGVALWKRYPVEMTFSGADLFYYTPTAPGDPGSLDVVGFRPRAYNAATAGTQEVSCVIGACYVTRKDWFDYIGGLDGLEGWSLDEWLLSVKTWLAGGDVRVLNSLHVGHILYPGGKEMDRPALLYNKLVMAYVTLPASDWCPFVRYFPRDSALGPALERFDANRERLARIRERNFSVFQRDVYFLCDRFKLNHPADLGAEVLI